MKWAWFVASAFSFVSVAFAINTIATLATRVPDSRSDRDAQIASTVCLYLLIYVLIAAGLGESAIK